MNPNPVNEFLPSAATPDRMDLDDDFDMARWQALRKDKLEEQKRLDEEHHQTQMQIEMQLEAENQLLLSQVQHKVQESIQQVFVDLQQSIVATVGTQVELRLQQQRLRDEHAASTASIEQRHLNKITHLMAPSSARAAKPHDYSVRESLTPKPFNIPVSLLHAAFGYAIELTFINRWSTVEVKALLRLNLSLRTCQYRNTPLRLGKRQLSALLLPNLCPRSMCLKNLL